MKKQYVITREQMYYLDKRTMQEFPIESQVLMEVAGLKSTQRITDIYNIRSHSYLILCGHGNNGGDGFVIARWLLNMSAKVELLFVGDEQKMSPETNNNYQLCKKLKCPFIDINSFNPKLLSANTVVIDALLGIGFQGELREPLAYLIKEVNILPNPRIAIDIPSGVNANSGIVNIAFKADYTFTMAAIKEGMLLNSAPLYCGKIEVIDISIPEQYYQELESYSTVCSEMKFPNRFKHSHKGDYGKVLIIAGSPSFSGAAILSAKACVKAGAGLVKLLHPQGMETIFESSLTEVMTQGVTSESNIDEYLEWADVILIGPGLGQSKEAEKLLTKVLSKYAKPIVIDADGINMLAKKRELLLQTRAKILLTPHLGEFSRLCGKTLSEVKSNLVKIARAFIEEYPASLLLKSSNTLSIDEKRAIFTMSGNDGLSTGGSGDVLAGIITSFIGQKMDLSDSAVNASYYLGKIVEKLSESQQPFSILPTEIINSIGKEI